VKLKVNIDGYIGKEGFNLSKLKSIIENNNEASEIHFNINSEGGDVFEGWAIHDYIKSISKEKKVTAKVEGVVASITTIILGAIDKDNVTASKNASGYIHNPIWTPNSPTPLEAKELEHLSSRLKVEQDKIYNFYTSWLTATKEEILALMESAVKLTAEKMLSLGMIGSIDDSMSLNFRNELPIKAQINIENMKEFTQEQQSWLERKFSTLKALLKGNIKNMVVKLDDDREVFVFTEDGDLMGKRVVTVENGEPTETPAPNGEHATEDGRVIVVADGVITEVKEAADVEAAKKKEEELMNKVTALETQLAEMTAKLTEAETLKAAAETNIENAKKEFDNFKAQLLTGKIEEFQDFSKGAAPQKTLTEKAIEFRNKQKQK
jgi:ATP-dependent protease ClpP protease subunit